MTQFTNKTIALLIAGATILLASPANAQSRDDMAEGHTVLLGVEQVMGYGATRVTVKQTLGTTSQETKIETDGLALLGGMRANFSADFFVIPKLTLGGMLQYRNTTGSTETAGVKTDEPETTFWKITPRVGYYTPLNSSLAFWIRGGLSFQNDKTESKSTTGATSTRETGFTTVSISPALLVYLAPNFALNFSFTGESIVSSSYSESPARATGDVSLSGQLYTLAAGLTGAI